jgi:hypothetical protein
VKLSNRVLSLVALSLSFVPWAASAAPLRVADALAKLPLRFERNDGQTDREVAYLSRGQGSTLFLTRTEAVVAVRDRQGRGAKTAVLRLLMVGANGDPVIAGEEPLQGKMNYFIGNDRSRWQTGVPTYRRVRYDDVWPGIDLVWHGTQNALEYDFIVAPRVDPSAIRLQVNGAKRLRLDRSGNLIAETAAGNVVQHAPVLYQDGPGGRTAVAGKYVLRGRREVGFEIGAYDATRPLVIDPVLEYSTFLGGTRNEEAFGIAVDGQGNAYVTGSTESVDFPRAVNITDETRSLLFVAKLNAAGTDLVYSTLIGADTDGIFPEDEDPFFNLLSTGIAVTADGKACITGRVDNVDNDSNYPLTDNAFQGSGFCLGAFCGLRQSRGFDAFVTVLSADGEKLVYSTLYGGSRFGDAGLESIDRGDAIAVDAAGHVYIAGTTNANDLPTKNAFQSGRASSGTGTDAFIAVFDPAQERGNDTLLYASFLGGSDDDRGLGIAVDPDRNAYVVGKTRSSDLETKAPAGQTLPPLQAAFQGGTFDGFVAKVDTESDGDPSLTYLTYFGGRGNDRVEAVAVDEFQRTYFAGASNSEPSTFPLVNAFDSTQRNGEAFVAKFNADGTALFYSTFLGGENANTADDFEEATGIAIDPAGNAYVTGSTTSGDTFPAGTLEAPLPAELSGTVFVAKVGASVSATAVPPLIFSTTFGGSRARARGVAVDASGTAYIAGFTDDGLPTTAGVVQAQSGGERDAFAAKLSAKLSDDTTGLYDSALNEFQLRNANTTGPADLVVALGEPGDLPVVGDWDGDGVTDVGVFRPNASQFLLRLGSGLVVTIAGGNVGDLPVAGDWDGDGFDTVGVLTDGGRVGQSFFLTNTRVEASPNPDFDIIVVAGEPGDLPLAGDWNGDGLDTVGFYRPSTTTFFQIDDFAAGVARSFLFGEAGDLPMAGDWNGSGTDDVGVFRPSDRTMHLTTDLGATEAFVFELQAAGDAPVGGNWDGQ